MTDQFQRRHDPLAGWIAVFVMDWAIAAFCILLPNATARLRTGRTKTIAFITRVFCWCMTIHFFMLPIAAFTRVWQIRLATDLTLLAVFVVCYNRALSLKKERERELS